MNWFATFASWVGTIIEQSKSDKENFDGEAGTYGNDVEHTPCVTFNDHPPRGKRPTFLSNLLPPFRSWKESGAQNRYACALQDLPEEASEDPKKTPPLHTTEDGPN